MPDEPSKAIQDIAKKIAATGQKRLENDPHGFHNMSERELVDWMGRGNAVPGSVVYNHAELVLGMKRHRQEQTDRFHERSVDSFKAADPTPNPTREPGRLNAEHFAILGFATAVAAAVAPRRSRSCGRSPQPSASSFCSPSGR